MTLSPKGEESPFDQSIRECLANAEALLDDAKTLLYKGRHGIAQSLSVLSMEEGAKAVILALSTLQLVGKDVIKKSMRDHSPKQIILVGLEQSKLFLGKKLVGEVIDHVVKDEQALRQLKESLRENVRNLELEKQNGLYVDVDPDRGKIISAPKDAGRNDVQVGMSIARAEKNLELNRALVDVVLGDFRLAKKRDHTIWNLRIMWDDESPASVVQPYYTVERPDRTLVIMFDEV